MVVLDGEIAFFPVAENVHRSGILSTSRSPVDVPALAERAKDYVHRLLTQLDYVGAIAWLVAGHGSWTSGAIGVAAFVAFLFAYRALIVHRPERQE